MESRGEYLFVFLLETAGTDISHGVIWAGELQAKIFCIKRLEKYLFF